MNLCQDCKFYKHRSLRWWEFLPPYQFRIEDECWRGGVINPITGEEHARDANFERGAGYLCGPDASYFEAGP